MGILVHEVSKSLGDSKILDRVSFYVPKFSLTAPLGPSGSGKSSLLRIISGLDNCDQGNVWLHGINMTSISTQYRKMSFVFQHYGLFKHMTVYENISFGLRLRGFPSRRIENKVNNLLNCLRIADISFEYPSQLSGGQKQRIALARSLAIQPDFLLLDEPFGALDGELRRYLRKWLKRYLQDNKITTIMVTHDQREAISMADEIVILKAGRLLQRGKPKDIYDRPINHSVGTFLGSFIQIPESNESVDVENLGNGKKLEKFAFDSTLIETFVDQSIYKYHFFLRPFEFCINSEQDPSGSIPVQIEAIIYKRTFVQLDLFAKNLLWNFRIPIGYQIFRNLRIESLAQTLYTKPRIRVYPRAYPISTEASTTI